MSAFRSPLLALLRSKSNSKLKEVGGNISDFDPWSLTSQRKGEDSASSTGKNKVKMKNEE